MATLRIDAARSDSLIAEAGRAQRPRLIVAHDACAKRAVAAAIVYVEDVEADDASDARLRVRGWAEILRIVRGLG